LQCQTSHKWQNRSGAGVIGNAAQSCPVMSEPVVIRPGRQYQDDMALACLDSCKTNERRQLKRQRAMASMTLRGVARSLTDEYQCKLQHRDRNERKRVTGGIRVGSLSTNLLSAVSDINLRGFADTEGLYCREQSAVLVDVFSGKHKAILPKSLLNKRKLIWHPQYGWM